MAHCPAYWLAGEQIDYHSQISPAIACPDKAHIAAPDLIWCCNGELPVE
jgi:hypothetical protein|tara:strand:+ start:401 stop:547 length:147 start_codon:yes stop_codon:yes gene_type:complete